MGAGGYPDGALGRGVTDGVRPAVSGVCVVQLEFLVGGAGDVFRLQPLHRGDDGAAVAGGFFGLVAWSFSCFACHQARFSARLETARRNQGNISGIRIAVQGGCFGLE